MMEEEKKILEKKKRLANQMPEVTRRAEQKVVQATVDFAKIDAKTKERMRKIKF